jgi:hypothetical protein
MADRLSDACRRGRRAYRQGILASQNPYACSDERALAWDMGWQCEQDLDEFSESLNSKAYQPQVELDAESSDELLGWIKKQR